MKILSRPKIKQPCEEIVQRSLQKLMYRGHHHNVPELPYYESAIELVLNTLGHAKVLTNYRVYAPQETTHSTYGNPEWVIKIFFTDEPHSEDYKESSSGYVAALKFKFTRQV